MGQPGDFAYPGPRVLSEPESRFAFDLITHLRPTVTIWFHQPLGVFGRDNGNQLPFVGHVERIKAQDLARSLNVLAHGDILVLPYGIGDQTMSIATLSSSSRCTR